MNRHQVRPFGTLPDRFEPESVDGRAPVGLAVILPGGNYSPAAPLLEFGRQAVMQHGFTAQQVWWDVTGDADDARDDVDWVGQHLTRVVEQETDDPARVLVVAKSLGTLAAPVAAERGWDAIWLTPLLRRRPCVEGIRAGLTAGARQLVLGGDRDEYWDADVAAELADAGCDVVTIAGADHALWAENDAVASARMQLTVSEAIEAFLTDLLG